VSGYSITWSAVASAPKGSESGRCLSVADYVTVMGSADWAPRAGGRWFWLFSILSPCFSALLSWPWSLWPRFNWETPATPRAPSTLSWRAGDAR